MSHADQLSVLHVASFFGNIGDNANHNGTRRLLERNLDCDLTYTESEIRKYYQNYYHPDAKQFNEDFVSLSNNHDFVIFGSGNFFDLWISDSATGTTIDLPPSVLNQIDSPVIFYGLGCDTHKGIPEGNREKFERFLEHVLEDQSCLVSVRNDGSIENIATEFGSDVARRVQNVPDGGFFVDVDDTQHPEISSDRRTLGINVAMDMPDIRFPDDDRYLSYDEFTSRFAQLIDGFLSEYKTFDVVFFPHIYSDFQAISNILNEMDVLNRRKRVSVASSIQGEGSERYFFDGYRKCDLTIGMRFHSNVCPIGLGTPTIGLTAEYPKVEHMYGEIGMPERSIRVSRDGFQTELHRKLKNSVENQSSISSRYGDIRMELKTELDSFHERIRLHLTDTGVL